LAHKIDERAGNGHILLAEDRAHSPASRAKILADAAPAIPRAERRLSFDIEPHRATETSARNRQEKASH
jgi:hypothetical protein